MSKKKLSEADIISQYILPAVQNAGWELRTQVRQNVYFTDGRLTVRGKIVSRGKRKFADIILYYKPNLPLALIEAKDNNHTVGQGMPQALGYAETLDISFVYSSNGDAFLEHDRTAKVGGTVECQIALDEFPSPDDLWNRYCNAKAITSTEAAVTVQDYYDDGTGKTPRYYQQIAINRTVEAIAKGQNRILLVMATGTGKTYTAFQIIWRLWKGKQKKRILFLADRNILVDQARNNDFKPFGSAMTKITGRKVDKSYEIYLALYQAVSGTEEERNIFKEFSKDFFDLIVVDECHRGSAADDSAWREILEYFSSATQIGLTATPKETKDVSNIHYFGDPIYTYSLRQGIEDGFLSPYKVIRIDLDRDLEGWHPTPGERDVFGHVIDDRIYNQRDFDRSLVLDERTKVVARRVTEYLKATNRYDKTIIFCEDIDHAERMRQALVNENPDLAAENRKYVMRITGDDKDGKQELDNFILPESRYPVIATTSKLLTTGVDVQTCKLIVLDQNIQSMTEFKQIIGRGTRIREDFDKRTFTIMDFRKVTDLFADPDFDGDPVSIYEPKLDEPIMPPEDDGEPTPDDVGVSLDTDDGEGKPRKFYVKDVEVSIVAERVRYLGPDGQLITESLKDFTKKSLSKEFSTLRDFLTRWNTAEKKRAIIEEIDGHGILFEALSEEVGKDFDPFDLICHVVFDRPPLTRRQRAARVRKENYFTKYGEQARVVLNALLEKYSDDGIENIETLDVLKVTPLANIGTPVEIIRAFGGKDKYLAAVRELADHLYTAA